MEESHPSLQARGCAAFSVESNAQERLVIAAEINRAFFTAHSGRDRKSLVQAIRQAVTEHHDLRAEQVLLLKPASLPKTTSGKIQRSACRDRFLSGSLELLDECKS